MTLPGPAAALAEALAAPPGLVALLDPADLRGRFRWMGLYTQRAEGFPGTDTGHVDEELLDAPHFMMRVRVDGGGEVRVL